MTLLLWLLLLTPSYAQVAIERLCFNSDAEAARARPIIEVVLIKGQDRVEVDGRCLNVTCDVKRTEVLNRWIKTRLPQAQSTFSSMDVPELECDMLATKKIRKNEKLTTVQVDGRSFQVSDGSNNAEQSEEHILKVSSGGTANLRMDTTELKITCTNNGNGTYRLKFEQNYIAPPPVLVNGLLVQPPQKEKATSLSTELEARKGTPVKLGQISRDLANKQQSTGIPSGVNYANTDGSESVDWTLLIR